MTVASLGQPDLVRELREEILATGPLTFARFMGRALHHPRWGYYAAGAERLGAGGDFVTASDMGHVFGATVARQIAELDEFCGRPSAFDLIEFGAGRGLLARDIRIALEAARHDLVNRLRYTAVDSSEGMRRAIGSQVPDSVVSAEGAPSEGGQGCVLAMELLDALPVHRIRRRDGRLREIGVDWDGDRFVDTEMDCSNDVLAWAERYGAAAEEGFEAEVCPALEHQFERFDAAVSRGFLIVLDYGDTAERLYGAERPRGTLLAYHAHRSHEDYLVRVGCQDLTAHVNFSALGDTASARGWRLLGHTTQDRFLIANGILEEFERMDEAAYRDPGSIQRREHIKRLIEPGGMGRIFQVWMFAKGLPGVPRPSGLSDPFAR